MTAIMRDKKICKRILICKENKLNRLLMIMEKDNKKIKK
jgi:hypothetical protein